MNEGKKPRKTVKVAKVTIVRKGRTAKRCDVRIVPHTAGGKGKRK